MIALRGSLASTSKCFLLILATIKCEALHTSAKQRVLFIRHGVTEMNEWLAKPGCEWGAIGFKDAGLYDTRLTTRGALQARKLGDYFSLNDPGVELLVCSPLTRALETARHVFSDQNVSPGMQKTVSALCAERVYLSSDIGRSPSELSKEFDFADISGLGDPWWFTPGDSRVVDEWRPAGTYCCPGEPLEVFHSRLGRFKAWLGGRPEKTIAVVSHWGVIAALTGRSVRNCEVVEIDLKELLSMPLALEEEA
eukprot:CAMPEP_0172633392 /NCGR_PEP_ID=MMETSP1068-20121228/189198_1 /TAXON_ID=35684 /ORGANISM="Pseudopedinella elastica, Strain CCMP716" /LENGTH=251 /DNA_ID=CAMNT_0013445077 /DNA_START=60 /DNA_END=815 /DNA_ORIENTATION=-